MTKIWDLGRDKYIKLSKKEKLMAIFESIWHLYWIVEGKKKADEFHEKHSQKDTIKSKGRLYKK